MIKINFSKIYLDIFPKFNYQVDSMKASVGYPQNIDNITEENKAFSYFVSYV